MEHPKHKRGDTVKITSENRCIIGEIIVVDTYGGGINFDIEPSYDVMGADGVLYKHMAKASLSWYNQINGVVPEQLLFGKTRRTRSSPQAIGAWIGAPGYFKSSAVPEQSAFG